MPARAVHKDCFATAAPNYERRCPEQTLLYQLIERHYPVFLEALADQGHALPIHGVFAPSSKLRSQVTLSGRGKRPSQAPLTPAERRQSMNWAQRLKRVFQIDLSQCACGGTLKILASIEDEVTIRRILDHLERHARGPPVTPIAPCQ